MALVPEIDQIREILTCIGFANDNNRTSIIDDAFNTYATICSLKEEDINEMRESSVDVRKRMVVKTSAFVALKR